MTGELTFIVKAFEIYIDLNIYYLKHQTSTLFIMYIMYIHYVRKLKQKPK